jgi:hypothetical protein
MQFNEIFTPRNVKLFGRLENVSLHLSLKMAARVHRLQVRKLVFFNRVATQTTYFKMLTTTTLPTIQDVFESCAEILTTSYWLHAELGKNI